MVKTALILSSLALILTPSVFAGTANVTNDIDVKSSGGNSTTNISVDNKVNTGNSTTTTSTQTTKTDIDINQSGEGHSSVTINGKEYKVDGPGSLSIRDGNSSTNSPSPSTNPPSSPSTSPSATSSSNIDIHLSGPLDQIISLLEKLLSSLKNLL